MQRYAIGVDVGATKIAAGIITDHRAPEIITIRTPKSTAAAVVTAIANSIKACGHKRASGIGIGIAGAVNAQDGIVYASPNMPKNFRNIRLATLLKKSLKCPVRIENDAKCFTLAEATYGAGRGKRTVIGFTLGSGVGGGVVVDGEILSGRNGLGGEFGHTTVVADGLRCSCGLRGHVESYACGGGMIRYYRQLTGKTVDTFDLERRAQRRETAALRTINYGAKILALAVSNAIAAFNPDMVVLGGGMTRVPLFWRPAVRQVKILVPYPKQLSHTLVVKSLLGNSAGVIGAVLAAQQAKKRP